MRSVEFAENLAQKDGEILIIINVGEEAAVSLAIAVPIDTVEVDVIEFILDLREHVVIDVFTFERGMTVVGSLEFDCLGRTRRQGNFLHAAARNNIDVLNFGIGFDTAADALGQHLGLVLTQIVFHEVCVAGRVNGHVIKLVTVGREHIVAHGCREGSEAADAHRAVVKIKVCGRLGFFLGVFLILFVFFLLFVLGVVAIGFFLFFLGLFGAGCLLLGQFKAVERLGRESHEPYVIFRAPRAVAALAGAVAHPGYSLAVERPAGIGVAITALGEVHHTRAVGCDKGDVAVVPSALADIAGEKVTRIGAPDEIDVTVRI